MTVRITPKDTADSTRLALAIKAANGGNFAGVSTDSSGTQVAFVVSEELAEAVIGVSTPSVPQQAPEAGRSDADGAEQPPKVKKKRRKSTS